MKRIVRSEELETMLTALDSLMPWDIAMLRARKLSVFWRSRIRVEAVRVRFAGSAKCFYLYRAVLK